MHTARLTILASLLTLAGVVHADIAGNTDASGTSLLTQLFANSGLPKSAVVPQTLEFVGVTDAGSQAGSFTSLVLQGDNNTSQTLGGGIVLSSGFVSSMPTTNTIGWWSNVTSTGGNNCFRDFPANTGTTRHSGRLQEHDQCVIAFTIEVPEGVAGVAADFAYASEEFPEWSGTGFADGFAFIVNDANYAVLPGGRPVSLLDQNDNIHFMPNGDSENPAAPMVVPMEYDGITRILTLLAPLSAGHQNDIAIVVADTGDEIYDSAVFLSSLRFVFGSEPIDPTDCVVRVRHNSPDDDAFVEFAGDEVCDSIDFNADGLYPDDNDLLDFLSVLAGGTCSTSACNDIDFNNDGLFPDDTDLIAYLNALAGVGC
jgi:hypothetical protein